MWIIHILVRHLSAWHFTYVFNDKGKEFYENFVNYYYQELELKRPEILYGPDSRGRVPYNVHQGIVFCGWRHANCIYAKCALTGLRDAESGAQIQGFLTNKNRFVDRFEGKRIALAADQIIERKNGYFNTNPESRLFSEDLW